MNYIETSAKTGEFVEEAFISLTKKCFESIQEEINEEVYTLQ